MLKAKTKELSRHNTRESNEMRKKKIKQKQQADRVLCAPTMVAAMKYLMLSGRMKREKSRAYSSCQKYNRPRSSFTRCGYLIQFSALTANELKPKKSNQTPSPTTTTAIEKPQPNTLQTSLRRQKMGFFTKRFEYLASIIGYFG